MTSLPAGVPDIAALPSGVFLDDEWWARALAGILAAGDDYGRGPALPTADVADADSLRTACDGLASVLHGVTVAPDAALPAGEVLVPTEGLLIDRLLRFPAAADAGRAGSRHALPAYARDLASCCVAFVRDCPIVAGDQMEAFRVALAQAAQHVLTVTLEMLGEDASG